MDKKCMSKRIICLVAAMTMLAPNVAAAEELTRKDESVFVNITDKGEVKKETVSSWIHSDEVHSKIEDKSILEGIKNVKGDEKPQENGGNLVWNTESGDIFYEGTTNKELPLDVKISYFLDDKEASPKDIAGKSGKVKIRFEFKNKDAHMVNVNGNLKTLYTPMTTVAAVMLPMDSFTNVKAGNGQVISEGNNQIVNFIAFPGLEESLNIKSEELKVLEMPNEFELTADCKNFKLAPIFITATPKLPDTKKLEEAKNIDDLKNGMKDMKDAARQLCDGTAQLKDGIGQAKEGSVQLKDAILMARGKMVEGKNQLDNSKDKIGLIADDGNVQAERTILMDAFNAESMNVEKGMVDLLKVIAASENVDTYARLATECRSLGIDDIMKDPDLQGILKKWSMMTPDQVNEKIRKGDVALGKAEDVLTDVQNNKEKLSSLQQLMKYSAEYNKLLSDAKPFLNIKEEDASKISSVLALYRYSANYEAIADEAGKLGKTIDYQANMDRINALVGVTQYIDQYAQLKDDATPLLLVQSQMKPMMGVTEHAGAYAKMLKDVAPLSSNSKFGEAVGMIVSNKKSLQESYAAMNAMRRPAGGVDMLDVLSKADFNQLKQAQNDLGTVLKGSDKLVKLLKDSSAIKDMNVTVPQEMQELMNSPEKQGALLAGISNSKELTDEQKSQLTTMLKFSKEQAPGLNTLNLVKTQMSDAETSAAIQASAALLSNSQFKNAMSAELKTLNSLTSDEARFRSCVESLKNSMNSMDKLMDPEVQKSMQSLETLCSDMNSEEGKKAMTALYNVLLTGDGEINESNILVMNQANGYLNKLTSDLNAGSDAMAAMNKALNKDNAEYTRNVMKSANDLNKVMGEQKEAIDAARSQAQNASYACSMLKNNAGSMNQLAGDFKKANEDGAVSALANVSPDALLYVQGLMGKVNDLQGQVNENMETLQDMKTVLHKASDPEMAQIMPEVDAMMKDMNRIKPVISMVMTNVQNDPDAAAKLKKAPGMMDDLMKMQNDLKNNKKILEVVDDALKENNIQQARALMNALPALSDGVNRLSDGAQALASGMNEVSKGAGTLSEGMNKFNDEGVLKLDSKVSPKIDDVKDLMETKDKLVELSKSYDNFSGKGNNMSGNVKFILKTDEIKAPEVKKQKKVIVNKEEQKQGKGIFGWIKNIFSAIGLK